MSDYLIVGLGNPGTKHEQNRHNIGFMAVDAIAEAHKASAWQSKFNGQWAKFKLGDDVIHLLKPDTFMNLSGKSVQPAMQFFKIPLKNIFVIYDELDLLPGKVRTKTGGGSGGHNGIKSIDEAIGPNYHRVRIGIGHPGNKDMVSSYVLHDFESDDWDWVKLITQAVAKETPQLISGRLDLFMTNCAAVLPRKEKEA